MSLPLLYWVYPGRNCRETSQWSFLVKASWHAPLICPLAKEKEEENWTQLRTETLFKELLNWKRVLALKAQIYDSISATVWAPSISFNSSLWPDVYRFKELGGDISPFWTESVWHWCQLMTDEGEKLGELLLQKLHSWVVRGLFESVRVFLDRAQTWNKVITLFPRYWKFGRLFSCFLVCLFFSHSVGLRNAAVRVCASRYQ